MKKCPCCAELIQDDAIKCRFCNEFLNKNNRDRWYFKDPFLIISFLCVGPLMLPLVLFNPYLTNRKKVVISVIIIVLSLLIGVILAKSVKALHDYYQQIFSLSF